MTLIVSSGYRQSMVFIKGFPIFPHTTAFLPASTRIFSINVTTVVLPLVPVTAIVFFFASSGISFQANSISLQIGIPLLSASLITPISFEIPGLTTARSIPFMISISSFIFSSSLISSLKPFVLSISARLDPISI